MTPATCNCFPTPQPSPWPKKIGKKPPAEFAIASNPRLPLDDGSVDSGLCAVAECGESLVADIPETVLCSACCEGADEIPEENGQSTWSGRVAEEGMVRGEGIDWGLTA